METYSTRVGLYYGVLIDQYMLDTRDRLTIAEITEALDNLYDFETELLGWHIDFNHNDKDNDLDFIMIYNEPYVQYCKGVYGNAGCAVDVNIKIPYHISEGAQTIADEIKRMRSNIKMFNVNLGFCVVSFTDNILD